MNKINLIMNELLQKYLNESFDANAGITVSGASINPNVTIPFICDGIEYNMTITSYGNLFLKTNEEVVSTTNLKQYIKHDFRNTNASYQMAASY